MDLGFYIPKIKFVAKYKAELLHLQKRKKERTTKRQVLLKQTFFVPESDCIVRRPVQKSSDEHA